MIITDLLFKMNAGAKVSEHLVKLKSQINNQGRKVTQQDINVKDANQKSRSITESID